MDPKLLYIETLKKRGYTETFTPSGTSGLLTTRQKLYRPGDVKINGFYTCSSDSDPTDYFVLFAIETKDGKKGILVNEHCEKPDEKIEGFINSIKTAKENKKSWFKNPLQKMFRVKLSMNM